MTTNKELSEHLTAAEELAGRTYAPEFIDMLAETCGTLLTERLRANPLTERLADLADAALMLKVCAELARSDRLAGMAAVILAQEIPSITRLIVELGGAFCDPAGEVPGDKAS
jgi:hypothetical protein